MSRWSLLDREAPQSLRTVELVGADPALVVVDEALNTFAERTFIARDEVLDRLLDLRNVVAAAALLRTFDTEVVPR